MTVPPLTEQEVLDVLHAIERGETTFLPEDVAALRNHYDGPLRMRTSNGWTFEVFNDRREWQYIEYVKAPDGREVEDVDAMPGVARYVPPDRWGLDY